MNTRSRAEESGEELLVPPHRRHRVLIALSVFLLGLLAVNWVSHL